MTFGHSNQNIANRKAVFALTLLLTCAGSVQLAVAQDSASAGSYSAANALGPDLDSLLPPEVVPLDPASANSMSAAQAAKRQSTLGAATEQSNAPGLMNSGMPGNQGMQTAQEARKAAFDSLYGQPTLQQQPAFRAGEVSQSQMIGQNPMNNPTLAPYQQAPNTMPAQSQTLTGGSKVKPIVRDIRRAGMSNAISAMAGFGAGALMSGAMIRPSNPMMGLGIFGMTMTGFGVRNAFRF
jgi:hypothetical protein